MAITRENVTQWLKSLQENICKSLEEADGKGRFSNDEWHREAGGGGISRVLTEGAVIEKGGVMFSAVSGPAPAFLMREHEHSFSSEDAGATPRFFATGVSIVIHPSNPFVPIIHMNTRYFELCDGNDKPLKRWFGGGIDLTPHYVAENDARFFHTSLRNLCDRYDPAYYQKFKKWADDYFFLPHRGETRGIGGIFYDKLGAEGGDGLERTFAFWQDTGSLFAPLYCELISRNRNKPFSADEKQWQLIRRGRYVEFNLVYDKGTKFGLESGGRIESILVSLPKTAGWEYNYIPSAGSKEAHTLSLLRKGIDWAQ